MSISSRPTGVTLVAIYQFASAAILLLAACAILFFAMPAMLFIAAAPGDILTVFILLLLALAGALALGIASAVVGWGLLRRDAWARTGAIVLAIPALFGFPIWTVAAVVVLLYLMSNEGRVAFGLLPPLPTPSHAQETRELRVEEGEKME